jgi:hypothetical protein
MPLLFQQDLHVVVVVMMDDFLLVAEFHRDIQLKESIYQ